MAWFTCHDGFRFSAVNFPGTYSGPGHVEVGFPSERPEPWDEVWAELCDDTGGDPTQTVYAWVKVEHVVALAELHGGIADIELREREQAHAADTLAYLSGLPASDPVDGTVIDTHLAIESQES